MSYENTKYLNFVLEEHWIVKETKVAKYMHNLDKYVNFFANLSAHLQVSCTNIQNF